MCVRMLVRVTLVQCVAVEEPSLTVRELGAGVLCPSECHLEVLTRGLMAVIHPRWTDGCGEGKKKIQLRSQK